MRSLFTLPILRLLHLVLLSSDCRYVKYGLNLHTQKRGLPVSFFCHFVWRIELTPQTRFLAVLLDFARVPDGWTDGRPGPGATGRPEGGGGGEGEGGGERKEGQG